MVSLALPQNAFQHLLRAGQISLLINIINGLLVVWLAWQLAGLSWLVWPSSSREEVEIAAEPQPVQRKQAVLNEKQLADWHLFGEAGKHVIKKETPLVAPETRLKLTLKGVFASEEEVMGRAIIADPKGKEDSYAVGDPLPGGASLSEIYPDRIILERSGGFETLRLPKDRGALAPQQRGSRRTTSRTDTNNQPARVAAFNKYRSEIKQNPSSFLNYVRATPARQNGKFVGFRLQAGKQRGALKELGLKPGDIVTSINGVQIDAPAKGMKAMQALGEGSSVSVTLLRSGQEVSLNLTLPTSKR